MRGAGEFKTDRARRFRGASTNVEGVLWYRLRGRRLNGCKFVRQAPIGPYVVDFICRECRLIVKVDGGQRADSQSDAACDKWLVDRNYRVLRFWNSDVSRNLAGVLETIATALAGSPPHPDRQGDPASPRARGEAKVATITI